jgi:hypothetical protein
VVRVYACDAAGTELRCAIPRGPSFNRRGPSDCAICSRASLAGIIDQIELARPDPTPASIWWADNVPARAVTGDRHETSDSFG